MPRDLTEIEIALMRKGLGFDDVRAKKSPTRNFLSCHRDQETIKVAHALEGLGFLTHDHGAAFGKMHVFRVTPAGFAALGIKTIRPELRFEAPYNPAPLRQAA